MTPKLTIKTILKRFDSQFGIWKATDNGAKSENFPENHNNLAMQVKSFLTLSLNQLLDEIKIEKREGKQGEDCDCIMGDNGEFYEGCGCKINTWNSAIDELEKLKNKLR
jgi:hypothetical protein